MFNLAIALVGVVALSRLPVRELPDIDPLRYARRAARRFPGSGVLGYRRR
ncbi:MAG: hypothetical protein ABT940_13850 [Alphaproteobacteria bacterium]